MPEGQGLLPPRRPHRPARSAGSATRRPRRPTSHSSSTTPPAPPTAPHHVPKEWADRYKGKFDQGWDKLREETFARQKELGVIPADAELTPRDPAFPAWDSLSPAEKTLYARQMEVYAGFQENTDHQVGRVVEAIEEMGIADNTLILYIWGDNGSSMEGTETGTFNEMTTLTGIPLTAEQQLKLIDAYGGIDAWGGPVMQPHFACAWAWAGNTPFQWGKQVASHFGGTRNPMVVSWPRRIKDQGGLRSQFTHVIDVAPTILEVAGIPRPSGSTGSSRCRSTASSFAYTFDDADAEGRHTQQYFEIFGNRAMYKDGWIACARLDRIPWKLDPATLAKFAPEATGTRTRTRGNSTTSTRTSRRRTTSRPKHPEKLAELKALFWEDAEKYHVTPLLAGFASSTASRPPAADADEVHLLPGHREHQRGDDPADLQPLVHDHRRPGCSRRRGRGRDRRRVRRHGRVRPLRPGWQAALHLQLPGHRGRDRSASTEPLPAGKVPGPLRVHRRRARQAGHRRPRSAVHQRPATSARTTWSGPCPAAVQQLRRDGHRQRQRRAGLPSYAAKSPFAFTGKIGKVVFDLAPSDAK